MSDAVQRKQVEKGQGELILDTCVCICVCCWVPICNLISISRAETNVKMLLPLKYTQKSILGKESGPSILLLSLLSQAPSYGQSIAIASRLSSNALSFNSKLILLFPSDYYPFSF
jgi:hypothetical protein